MSAIQEADQRLAALEEKWRVIREETVDLLYKKEKAFLLLDLGRKEEALPLWKEVYEKVQDRESGFALLTQMLEDRDMEGVIRISEEILLDEKRDRIRYMSFYYRTIAYQQLGSDEEHKVLEEALKGFDELKGRPSETLFAPMKSAVYDRLGRATDALECLKLSEETLQNIELEENERSEGLETISVMRERIQNRMPSFT
jgi:tetratricopeptide (TPR) repeat protein